ncbi:DUF2946 domain-containing protein [Marinobacter sp. BGYM27]|uniref:DUF2946 domain-containing protein n=1 Tax=Marinobacter sp. BGYM27 TaxID=2975597 RepID=UPI0021A4E9EF|nr:DUF2946 domain-containing protein [Marinobacter sp. BGYM27]MDG5501383.1 DUF2946 domain-containing protein [Marinobacter sp. BGYM27]
MNSHCNTPSSLLGFDRRQRQRSAWLALLSMVLLFAGPLISNVQAAFAKPAYAMCLASPAQPDLHDTHSGHHVSADASGQPQLLHASCGYCTLLFHTSSMAPQALVIATPTIWGAIHPPIPTTRGYSTPAAYALAQGRAPPGLTI